MRKKLMLIILVIIGVANLTACANEQPGKLSNPNTVENVLRQQTSENESVDSEQIIDGDNDIKNSEITLNGKDEVKETVNDDQIEELNDDTKKDNKTINDEYIDYDLTTMSSDMVYSLVFQMMETPEDYIGTKVKISGLYYANYYEPTGKYYHCVLIQDALACCAQGMEFVWGDGSYIYPDDYPDDGTEVEVIGVFDTYTENDDPTIYPYLSKAEIKILEN
ncbi:MAG: hypothetical protein K0S41_1018 [Anaerocolumna sp.]|jgi:hypothetical protein|nr:hypothetical protein [Anaerocolumna sp.]